MTFRTSKPIERAGVWIDQKTAFVIKVSADHSPIIEKIETGIKARGAAEDIDKPYLRLAQSDPNRHDKIQQHQHQELQVFFQDLIKHLEKVDYVYIFGPGRAKHGLNNAIEKEGSQFRCKVAGIDAADKLTENQMRQHVIDFFTSLRYEDFVRRLSIS